jgi:hypothetical protein
MHIKQQNNNEMSKNDIYRKFKKLFKSNIDTYDIIKINSKEVVKLLVINKIID